MNLENQRMKIVDESILFFFWVSLKILSRSPLHFMYKGIYSRVCMECEESVTTK